MKPKNVIITVIVLMQWGAAVRCSAWLGHSAAEAHELSNVARDNISAVSFLVGDVLWKQGCELVSGSPECAATPRINVLNDALGVADKLMNVLHVGGVSRGSIAPGYATKLGQPLAEKLNELQTPIQARAEQVEAVLGDSTKNATTEKRDQKLHWLWHLFVGVLGFTVGFALWPNDESSATG